MFDSWLRDFLARGQSEASARAPLFSVGQEGYIKLPSPVSRPLATSDGGWSPSSIFILSYTDLLIQQAAAQGRVVAAGSIGCRSTESSSCTLYTIYRDICSHFPASPRSLRPHYPPLERTIPHITWIPTPSERMSNTTGGFREELGHKITTVHTPLTANAKQVSVTFDYRTTRAETCGEPSAPKSCRKIKPSLYNRGRPAGILRSKHLTTAQKNILEDYYRTDQRPDSAQRRLLAQQVSTTGHRIKIWYVTFVA